MEYIQTDIWVRFQRMRGHEVHYVGADDTHGTPIMLRAEKEGITPKELIANVWKEHKRDFDNAIVKRGFTDDAINQDHYDMVVSYIHSTEEYKEILALYNSLLERA